jgi:hypothetical protein
VLCRSQQTAAAPGSAARTVLEAMRSRGLQGRGVNSKHAKKNSEHNSNFLRTGPPISRSACGAFTTHTPTFFWTHNAGQGAKRVAARRNHLGAGEPAAQAVRVSALRSIGPECKSRPARRVSGSHDVFWEKGQSVKTPPHVGLELIDANEVPVLSFLLSHSPAQHPNLDVGPMLTFPLASLAAGLHGGCVHTAPSLSGRSPFVDPPPGRPTGGVGAARAPSMQRRATVRDCGAVPASQRSSAGFSARHALNRREKPCDHFCDHSCALCDHTARYRENRLRGATLLSAFCSAG